MRGNRISLYDGSAGWDTLNFAEASVTVPSTTTTPFDIFAYNNSGTIALEALSWTNDTTRATALTTQDGVLVKTGATTRRYLGTGRTTGVSGQIEDSDTSRLLWNYYNRVARSLLIKDSTSHGYATAAWRYWNNDSGNKLEFVLGVAEDWISYTVAGDMTLSDVGATHTAIGVDTAAGGTQSVATSIAMRLKSGVASVANVAIGYHYLAMLEYGNANNPTFASGEISAVIMG